MPSKQEIEAGRAFVRLFLKNDMAKQLTTALKAAGSQLQSFGRGTMAAGFAATKVAAVYAAPFIAGVKAASDMEETMNKFNVVFGDNADAMKAWGDTYANEVGRSKQQIADFLAASQDLLVPMGFDATSAAEMSKTLSKLAVDLASFNNMSDADVLRDLQGALTGSSEVMKKYGVIVNEAAVKQEMLTMKLDPKRVTEAQKAQARLNIIMRGTTAAQGDAIRSAGSFANQMKALKAAAWDAAGAVGSAILPTVTEALKQVVSLAKAVGAWVANNGDLIRSAAAIGATLVVAGGAVTALGAALYGAGFAMSTLGAAVGALLSPWGLVTAAVVGAGVAFVKFTEAGKTAYRSISATLGNLLAKFQAVFGGISDAMQAGNLELAFDIMKTAARLALAEVGARATYVFKTLIPGLASATFQGLIGGFVAVVDGWRPPLMAYFNLLKAGFVSAFNFEVALTRSWLQLAGDLVGVLWNNFSALSQVAVQDSLAFLINGMIRVGEFIRNTIGDALISAVEAFVDLMKNAASVVKQWVKDAIFGKTTDGEENTVSKAIEDARKKREGENTKQRSMGDVAIAGIAGEYADADAVLAAVTEQTAEAVKAHMGRVAEAGKEAIGTIAPAVEQFNSAISTLSGDVRDSFMERFQEAFAQVDDYKDPEAVEALRVELNALIAEAAEAKGAAAAGGGAPDAGVPGFGGLAPARVQSGVALTATYSAVAARISGYQPGGGPEEKMASGIAAIDAHTKEQAKGMRELIAETKEAKAMYQQFLAGWNVA